MTKVTCPKCNGSGLVFKELTEQEGEEYCIKCNGTGTIEEPTVQQAVEAKYEQMRTSAGKALEPTIKPIDYDTSKYDLHPGGDHTFSPTTPSTETVKGIYKYPPSHPQFGQTIEIDTGIPKHPDTVPSAELDAVMAKIVEQVAKGHKATQDEFKRHCPCKDCAIWRAHEDTSDTPKDGTESILHRPEAEQVAIYTKAGDDSAKAMNETLAKYESQTESFEETLKSAMRDVLLKSAQYSNFSYKEPDLGAWRQQMEDILTAYHTAQRALLDTAAEKLEMQLKADGMITDVGYLRTMKVITAVITDLKKGLK